MTNNYINNQTSTSKKSPTQQKKIQNDDIIDDFREEDERRHNFSIIDNEFIAAGFDSDTMSVYLRIVWRAANNNKGFFESRENTSRFLNISTRQLDYCRILLQYCNIIKITKRYDPQTKKQISSVIVLNDKSLWNLAHEWRRAGDFGRRNAVKNKTDTLHPVQPPPASSAATPLHPVQTEQEPNFNQITNKQDHLKGGEEKKSTNSKLRNGYASTLLADMLALVFYPNWKYPRYPNKDADDIMTGIMARTGISKTEAIDILGYIVEKQIPYMAISPSKTKNKNIIVNDFVHFIGIVKEKIK